MRTPVHIDPKQEFPTRANRPGGIEWNGYLFEACPRISQEKYERRVAVIEDRGNSIVIQAYSYSIHARKSTLTGEPYECKLIGTGRPTDQRIDILKKMYPSAQKTIEKLAAEIDELRKALDLAAKDVRYYGKFSEPGDIEGVIPRDGNWYVNQLRN